MKNILRDEVKFDHLYTPTQIVKIGRKYYIEDCWHHRIIFNKDIHKPINEWDILTDNVLGGHTIAQGKKYIVADDTDNDRLLIFEKRFGRYSLSGSIYVSQYLLRYHILHFTAARMS